MVPTVSIVLPTFNRLPFLREAVDSVFAQTFVDWELIIADDGSEAQTLAYLEALERLPKIKVLKLAHSGNPGAVRNAAWRRASGRFIAFLDSDDVWMPDKLRLQLAAHETCGQRRWSYTALERIDASGAPMRDGLAGNWVAHEGAIFEKLLAIEAAVATPSVLIDRSLLECSGGFDERLPYFEDYDLWLRLSLLDDVIVVDTPLVKVRNHAEHYSADRIAVYQARFKLLDKVGALATTPRLRAVLRRERAKNSASLALACAAAGRRSLALRMLWRSRSAWNNRLWWRKAAATGARVLAPAWLQQIMRRHRRRLRTMATAP